MKGPVLNSQKAGLLLGLLLPVISFFIFYLVRFREIPLPEFVNMVYLRNVLSPLLSLNILPNLLLFFVFIRKDYLLSAKGVLLATFLFAIGVFILKVLS